MNKKILSLLSLIMLLSVPLVAVENEPSLEDDKNEIVKPSYDRNIPAAKRPGKPSDELLEASKINDSMASEDYIKEVNDKLNYGLEDTINELIDELTKNGDYRFMDEIYDLFEVTKSNSVKQKIIEYFNKLKDPCLEDFAVTVILDPYDEKKNIVLDCITYAGTVKTKEALPGLIDMVDNEESDYFSAALTCIGEVGGDKEAVYLSEYIDRDDLSDTQKQSLMKVLGKLKALDTWDKIADIAQDDDQNSYVRMYAAEAIGAMQKQEGEDILIKLYEEDDANLRLYVIKGIKYFNDSKSDALILQALRDSQYKVRLEAIDAAKEHDLKDSVPFLIYRCKDSNEENVVKEKCYPVIAELNTSEGNDFLISILQDKKKSDNTKSKVASALMKFDNAGQKEIKELTEESLKDDKMKNLRYSLGKEYAKYGRSDAESICAMYLDSKDVTTQGIGLDIWSKARYSSLKSVVENIAADSDDSSKKKKNANAAKAKRILQM